MTTLLIVLLALGGVGLISGLLFTSSILKGQPAPLNPPIPTEHGSTEVFTPSHSSISMAVRHFFGLRPDAVQPIAYNHKPHIEQAQMECLDCHTGALTGPRAIIPGVRWCMTCHNTVGKDKPAVQQIAAYFNRGEEIPWQRVYGWNDESHVRFNHAPHLAASVSCAKCHGDVGSMADAKRVVDHSMGFCITCHKEKKASIDCVTCHF
jgi:cytochrome c7-like protein